MEYSCKCISHENNGLGGRSYVGIFKNTDNYTVIAPYGMFLPEKVKSVDREKIFFLKKYAHCITKALSKDKTRRYLQENCLSGTNPLSALNIVSDYVKNGLYRDYESENAVCETGKINFKKTISRVKPIVLNDEALYTEFVVSRKKVASQEIVSVAQGNVINHFMLNGGEILFGNLIRVNVPEIDLNTNLINQLRVIKANSFNSRKQQLIQWIIDYIQGTANIKEVGAWQYSIVASTLWEEMIDSCYSNQIKRNKTKYGRVYEMKVNGRRVQKSTPTQHDTIYETENELVIIDAKMYYSAKNLLSSEVLDKQFGYYLTAKKKNPHKKIFNVLVKPYVKCEDEKEGIIGEIPSPEICDDPNNFILVYAANFEKILNSYYIGKKISSSFMEEIKDYMKERECY